jgi:hypothetical protein
VVRQDARDGVPAVFRRRLPARFRSVDLRRGHKLGDDGAIDGVPGEDDAGIGGTIGVERNDREASSQPLCRLRGLRFRCMALAIEQRMRSIRVNQTVAAESRRSQLTFV